MNLVFFDDPSTVTNLKPFTFTRPVSHIRCGMLTMAEKWMKHLGIHTASNYTESYLESKFPLQIHGINLCINSSLFPNDELVNAIKNLQTGEMLFKNGSWLAGIFTEQLKQDFDNCNMKPFHVIEYGGQVNFLNNTWDIFSVCGAEIVNDVQLINKINALPKPFSSIPGVQIVGNPSLVYMEKGASIKPGSIINVESGPVYLGEDAEIMEGCLVRGPFYLGNHSQLKMGAKVYGPTSIGPHCKVGGEVNNSVFFGYSNKAHDGFLGNSVIGEWCNLGADTNNSNLKNNYAEVKLWNYGKQSFIKTGLQFCGLIMGDHSKCGINTMFNTGTVVGISANIFGDGFPRNYIPSFSWGGAGGFSQYKLADAISTAKLVYQRRGLEFDKVEQDIFNHLFLQEYPG